MRELEALWQELKVPSALVVRAEWWLWYLKSAIETEKAQNKFASKSVLIMHKVNESILGSTIQTTCCPTKVRGLFKRAPEKLNLTRQN
jgi:hypothetical protein